MQTLSFESEKIQKLRKSFFGFRTVEFMQPPLLSGAPSGDNRNAGRSFHFKFSEIFRTRFKPFDFIDFKSFTDIEILEKSVLTIFRIAVTRDTNLHLARKCQFSLLAI